MSILIVWFIGLGPVALCEFHLLKHQDRNPFYSSLPHVVDSTDTKRLQETSLELEDLLKEEDLKEVPVLIFANKQDVSTANRVEKVATELSLNTIRGRPWQVQPCSAKSGEGVSVGIEWLLKSAKKVAKSKKNKN